MRILPLRLVTAHPASVPPEDLESAAGGVLRHVGEIHLELTSTCNLHCDYCYAEVEKPGRGFPLFDLSLVRRTMEVLGQSSRRDHIQVIFHGGEPLLQSPDWYEDACSTIRDVLRTFGKTCDFGLQSNLVLLRDAHVDVFVRYGVKVGTSIDGPQNIHDAVRGKFASTVRNVARLVDAGLFSGAIAVIHHHNWEAIPELYATFASLDIGTFHLNIASAVGHGSGLVPLSEDQIFRVLCDDFLSMAAYDGKVVDTRLLAKLQRRDRRPTTTEFLANLGCDSPFCHAGINMVVIKYTGEVFPCGCAGTSGNMANFRLGTIMDGFNADFVRSSLRSFHSKSDKYERECRTCPARFVCEHGCPAFDGNDPVTPEHHCGATKRFEQFLREQPPAILSRMTALTPLLAAAGSAS